MERGQFTFYRSFYRAIGRIRSKSARADAYDAICAYALDGVLPELALMSDAAAIAFEIAQPILEASRQKAKSGNRGGSTKQTVSKTENTVSKTENAESKNKNKDKDKNKIKDKNKCYAGEGVADFDRFWEVYPRKVSKAAAKQAFAQVEVPVEVLIRAVQLQKQSHQWQKDGGQFIPNPASWLRQGRWEDELPKVEALPSGASGVLGQAELDNIRRILAEGGEGYAQGG